MEGVLGIIFHYSVRTSRIARVALYPLRGPAAGGAAHKKEGRST